MKSALVTEIQRFSIHDGPGIRTTVFLKGCPLSCLWCHNPECISFQQEQLYYPEKCIGCGCCDLGCFSGAKVNCGKEMTVSEVLDQVLFDKPYYKNGGGITVSGGEPLCQPVFVESLLTECKRQNLHTAIETSMYRYDERVLKVCDLIMADIKIFNDECHRKYTGVSNQDILRNIQAADKLGIPMIIRTPIIPGINDSAENVKNTADFVRKLKNVIHYELLPYHPLGLSKAKALGVKTTQFLIPTKEKMGELRQYADLSMST